MVLTMWAWSRLPMWVWASVGGRGYRPHSPQTMPLHRWVRTFNFKVYFIYFGQDFEFCFFLAFWLDPLRIITFVRCNGISYFCLLPLTVSFPAQASPSARCVELQPTGQSHPLLLLQEHLSLHHRGIVMLWLHGNHKLPPIFSSGLLSSMDSLGSLFSRDGLLLSLTWYVYKCLHARRIVVIARHPAFCSCSHFCPLLRLVCTSKTRRLGREWKCLLSTSPHRRESTSIQRSGIHTLIII